MDKCRIYLVDPSDQICNTTPVASWDSLKECMASGVVPISGWFYELVSVDGRVLHSGLKDKTEVQFIWQQRIKNIAKESHHEYSALTRRPPHN